jgi:hypothetical protein
LIDRGANGGIAGNDVCVISMTNRVVDVTGIDNHQLTSIKIGSVGALARSQRGPVIIIMHQYALHQQQRTIHSCVKLEYFKNKVDNRSLKAGGLQRLTTVDGYVFPIDIIQGLPYLKMVPYSDKEFINLPHVVLTADHPWRHNIFDCTPFRIKMNGIRTLPIGVKVSSNLHSTSPVPSNGSMTTSN